MKTKIIAFFVPLLSLASNSFLEPGDVITPDELAKSAVECKHQDAKVGSIRFSSDATNKALTIIEISSETMELTESDRCLRKKLRSLGSNFEMKLVSKNSVYDEPR